jgi:transcriptional regulator with XRE-family HTH domain
MAKTRTDAICELRRAGWKYAEIATVIGLSVSRVNQLLSDSGLQRKRRRKVPESVVNAVLTKPADEPYSSVAKRTGISRNAAIGIAYRAKKAEKVAEPEHAEVIAAYKNWAREKGVIKRPKAEAGILTPAPDLTLKSPQARRAAEIRAKYLQWAREAEVA